MAHRRAVAKVGIKADEKDPVAVRIELADNIVGERRRIPIDDPNLRARPPSVEEALQMLRLRVGQTTDRREADGRVLLGDARGALPRDPTGEPATHDPWDPRPDDKRILEEPPEKRLDLARRRRTAEVEEKNLGRRPLVAGDHGRQFGSERWSGLSSENAGIATCTMPSPATATS